MVLIVLRSLWLRSSGTYYNYPELAKRIGEKLGEDRMLSGQVQSSHHIIVKRHALSEVPCLHVQGSTLDVVQ